MWSSIYVLAIAVVSFSSGFLESHSSQAGCWRAQNVNNWGDGLHGTIFVRTTGNVNGWKGDFYFNHPVQVFEIWKASVLHMSSDRRQVTVEGYDWHNRFEAGQTFSIEFVARFQPGHSTDMNPCFSFMDSMKNTLEQLKTTPRSTTRPPTTPSTSTTSKPTTTITTHKPTTTTTTPKPTTTTPTLKPTTTTTTPRPATTTTTPKPTITITTPGTTTTITIPKPPITKTTPRPITTPKPITTTASTLITTTIHRPTSTAATSNSTSTTIIPRPTTTPRPMSRTAFILTTTTATLNSTTTMTAPNPMTAATTITPATTTTHNPTTTTITTTNIPTTTVLIPITTKPIQTTVRLTTAPTPANTDELATSVSASKSKPMITFGIKSTTQNLPEITSQSLKSLIIPSINAMGSSSTKVTESHTRGNMTSETGTVTTITEPVGTRQDSTSENLTAGTSETEDETLTKIVDITSKVEMTTAKKVKVTSKFMSTTSDLTANGEPIKTTAKQEIKNTSHLHEITTFGSETKTMEISTTLKPVKSTAKPTATVFASLETSCENEGNVTSQPEQETTIEQTEATTLMTRIPQTGTRTVNVKNVENATDLITISSEPVQTTLISAQEIKSTLTPMDSVHIDTTKMVRPEGIKTTSLETGKTTLEEMNTIATPSATSSEPVRSHGSHSTPEVTETILKLSVTPTVTPKTATEKVIPVSELGKQSTTEQMVTTVTPMKTTFQSEITTIKKMITTPNLVKTTEKKVRIDTITTPPRHHSTISVQDKKTEIDEISGSKTSTLTSAETTTERSMTALDPEQWKQLLKQWGGGPN